MVKSIRIYIEGDDRRRGKYNDISLREGFRGFLRELDAQARAQAVRLDIILGGSKGETFKDFRRGVKAHPHSLVIFLVDADAPLTTGETAQGFLRRQNPTWDWQGVEAEQCHLMVQIMESWFLADLAALEEFYGKKFASNRLPKNPRVEEISKQIVEQSLLVASQPTPAGEYHKTRHGAKLLTRIDPQKVRQAAPHCQRLFQLVRAFLNS